MNNNECLIVTALNQSRIDEVGEYIIKKYDRYDRLFATTESLIDDQITLYIGPSGCSAGSQADEDHHKLVDDVITFVDSLNEQDGRCLLSWVKVGFGERGQKILAGNNTNKISAGDYHENYHVKNVD